jgi:tRNA G10  N-methylase Trm11
MSEPRNDDVFLDPFAGTGTILAERATTDALAVIGTEIDSDVIPGLRPGRVGASANGSRVFEADARRLPVRDGTVDAVVSNLPFGRQVLDEDAIVPLYIDAASELRRVMSPNGRAILMTTRVDVIEAAMGAAGFVGEVLTTISLNGQNPSVLRYIRV